jgi:FAD/FMN-containing dehydrogenase
MSQRQTGDITGALEMLRSITGPAGIIDDDAGRASYLTDSRDLFHGNAALVLRPGSTDEVARIVQCCAVSGIAIHPIGGRTGMVGGGVPDADGRSIVLSLARLAAVRDVDATNYTLTAEAGCILANAQAAAAAADRLLPLSLNAEGSCTIGGNISTNAGGIGVLRYGNMRDLVLGLEVVMPDGEIWNGLRGLRKDNTGYDLKQLFVGAEGTLGIITAAVIQLFPRPRERQTAFVALESVHAAVDLLARLRDVLSERLSAFELMSRFAVECGVRHAGAVDPLAEPHPWYVLVEVSGGEMQGLRAALLSALEQGMENGQILDAVVAESLSQSAALWRLRESTWEGQLREGFTIKHDVSVPISAIPAFLARGSEACAKVVAGSRVFAFGHIGDGNIHFNVMSAAGADQGAFKARAPEVNHAVHDIVAELKGSVSAEHGIGRLKREALARYKSPIELRLMRSVKAALDPDGIMNPGHIFQ